MKQESLPSSYKFEEFFKITSNTMPTITLSDSSGLNQLVPGTSFILEKGIWLLSGDFYLYGGFSEKGYYRIMEGANITPPIFSCKTMVTDNSMNNQTNIVKCENNLSLALYIYNNGGAGTYNVSQLALKGIKLA